MKALIVGLGRMGRRHAQALRRVDPLIRIAGCRTRATSVDDLGRDVALFEQIHLSLEPALVWQPDVAIVSTPASLHVGIATQLATAGAHLLIEKPLSNSLWDVDALIADCRARSLTLMVGYNLRFDPALRALHDTVVSGGIGRVLSVRAEAGQFLPDWRPDRDYRETCSAHGELGGGALFELSHELDYVRWLGGDIRSTMASVRQVGDLGISADDTADLLVEFSHGGTGAIHVDMLDRAATRRCRVVGTRGTATWDGPSSESRVFDPETREWRPLCEASPGRVAETYVHQAEHFLSCVTTGAEPLVGGAEGLATLRLALAATRSSETGRSETV